MTLTEILIEISTNRLKLVVVRGAETTLLASFNRINLDGIPVVNIGKSLAGSLQSKIGSKHIDIEAQEALNNIITRDAINLPGLNYKTVCLHNIGMLFEPQLEIDESQFIRDLSKSYFVIILWENEIDSDGKLCWKNDKNKYQLNITDTDYHLITLNDEI
jgi:hypothetical protein